MVKKKNRRYAKIGESDRMVKEREKQKTRHY